MVRCCLLLVYATRTHNRNALGTRESLLYYVFCAFCTSHVTIKFMAFCHAGIQAFENDPIMRAVETGNAVGTAKLLARGFANLMLLAANKGHGSVVQVLVNFGTSTDSVSNT